MRGKITFFCVVFSVCAVFCGFTQDMDDYHSDEYGFQVKRPAAWYFFERDEQVDIFTEEGAYEAEKNAAGVTILVRPAEAEDGNDPEKSFRRFADDMGQDFNYSRAYRRKIGGDAWYAVPFTVESDDVSGEICAFVKNGVVYIMGIFYKFEGAKKQFGATVEKIVNSFRILPVAFKEFRDEEIGVSFEYPARSEPTASPGGILIPIVGSANDFSEPGAGIMLGVLPLGLYGEGEFDEKEMLSRLLGDSDDLEIVLQPTKATIKGKVWFKAEAVQGDAKYRVYLHNEFGFTFMIIFGWNPAEGEAMYDEYFSRFRDSLVIDMEKWAHVLQEQYGSGDAEETEEY